MRVQKLNRNKSHPTVSVFRISRPPYFALKITLFQNQTVKNLAVPYEALNRAKYGAGGRTRTDTVSLPRDFESRASTNFATPANKKSQLCFYISEKALLRQQSAMHNYCDLQDIPARIKYTCMLP